MSSKHFYADSTLRNTGKEEGTGMYMSAKSIYEAFKQKLRIWILKQERQRSVRAFDLAPGKEFR